MSATKPVVVAVDGSESASSAVVWAARTAVALGRPLHIATVVHIPAFYYSEPYLAESFKDELRRTATARLDSAQILARQSIDDDLEIVTELLDGSVSDRLIELSKSAYIIALGPRGHGEFTGLVVGSATVSVVSHGESPVAVVRGRTLDGRPPTEGPVVVGVDGSESSIEAVEHAFEQASARGATLIAVNWVVGFVSARSEKVEAMIEGSPVLLARDGEVYRTVLRKELISRADFDKALREAGCEEVDEVRLAVLETNGHITIIKRN